MVESSVSASQWSYPRSLRLNTKFTASRAVARLKEKMMSSFL
jgi:hypothetical protein